VTEKSNQYEITVKALVNYLAGNVDGAHREPDGSIVVDDIVKYHAGGKAVSAEFEKLRVEAIAIN